MLQISLTPDDYFTINGDIIVYLAKIIGGNRCSLAIEADRSIPIVRGSVLERNGARRPDCISKPYRKPRHYKPDSLFRWNDNRESAVRTLEKLAAELEQSGAEKQAQALRVQIDRIIPEPWEDDTKF